MAEIADRTAAEPEEARPPSVAAAEEDEEEGDVCRICRNRGDDDHPLRYPCACSGSIKFVHQDCLLQWLDHSNSRQCEVCKHAFSFSPVYADNAPTRLPFQELVVGVGMKACHVLQFVLRLAFVLSVWLMIIPFITYWIWRLTFVRSLGEAQRLFLSHISAQLILSDCLHGFLLSAIIVLIFLGATSLRDYIRHLRELGGHDAERDDAGRERHGARAVRRLAGPNNRVPAADGNIDELAEAQGIGAGELLRRNAENVAARLERLEAQVEQILDGLDDADGAEDVPFDELVGMQGPVFHLVENAITVLASNAIFLIVVIFVPFSLGRIVLYYLSWFFSSASNPMLAKVMPFTESAISLANDTLKSALNAVKNLSSDSHNEGVIGHVIDVVTQSLKINATGLNMMQGTGKNSLIKGTAIDSSYLSDLTTLAVGYMFIFCLVFLYIGSLALLRYARGERFTVGRLYGIATILEAIPSLCRQFFAGMKHLMAMIKVAFLLVIELGVFPLMCGWWLDVCTLKMLGATIAQRVEFFTMSPLASSSIHWVVGIVYMLQISIFVSLLRGVLRNGVLYFLRDPADPNYNPFRDLIDDPVHKHARRVLLSVAVYGSLIVMLVFLPVKLAMRTAPSIFPLDITIFDPFTEIPVDVLLFQICIPFAIEHFKPRATIKALLHHWFAAVGWALGLTGFLLPKPEENGVQEDWNGRAERRDRVHGMREAVAPQLEQPMIQHVAVDNNNVRGNTNEANDVAEESDADDQGDSEYGFVLRILLLLVLAWITLLIFNAGMIVIPISLGRMVFEAVPRLPITHGIKCNDLFSFSIGCYIIWSAAAGTRYAIDYIRSRQLGFLVQQICMWCSIFLKSSALLSIWIFVIPVLIGLLFELLVIVPMRVPIDESPVFLLYQDWALGLIFLKIWTRLKNPGLSAYANDPQKAAESLVSLLEEAEKVVPMELREQTPVRVGATAGLRALGTERSEEILQAVRDLLRDKSSFKSQPDWVTVLDGSQEGAFQWVTINYLLGKLGKPYSHTVGVVDLGGGSVQMAYAISEKDAAKAPQVSDGEGSYVNKLLLKGTTYYLYVHSYLHYGLLAARAEILKAGEGNDYSNCMLQGHHGKYKYGDDKFEASGLSSGASYSKCRAVAVRALKVDEPACTHMKCTFGGVWNGGGGDGQKNLFVASFFFDRAAEAGFVNPKESVAKVKPSDFEEAARRVCKLNVKDAQATYPDVSEENIPYLCMDLVYQYTLLVDGFGVDPYQDIMLVKKLPYSNSFVEAAWPLGSAIEVASSP